MNRINTIKSEFDYTDYISSPIIPESLITEAGADLQAKLLESVGQETAQEALIDQHDFLRYDSLAEEFAIRYGNKAPIETLADALIERHQKYEYILEQAAANPNYAKAFATINAAETAFIIRFKQENPDNHTLTQTMKRFLLQQALGWR